MALDSTFAYNMYLFNLRITNHILIIIINITKYSILFTCQCTNIVMEPPLLTWKMDGILGHPKCGLKVEYLYLVDPILLYRSTRILNFFVASLGVYVLSLMK